MANVGYARVSTRSQSLEAQHKALKGSVPDGDLVLFEEKVSAKDRNRPALNELLRYVRKGDVVIVTKLDRLARSTKHLLDIVEILEREGASLRILNINLDTGTPTGRLMLTMLSAIAQFERELMLERQAEGFEIAKAKGKINGRPATAMRQASEVRRLSSEGVKRVEIARRLNIGRTSVNRILKGTT